MSLAGPRLAGLRLAGPGLEPVAVDEELLATLYRLEAVDTRDISQSWSAYLGHLIETARTALFEAIGQVLDTLLGASGAARVLAFGVVAIAAVLLTVGLVRWIVAVRRRRRRGQVMAVEAELEPGAPREVVGAAAWRQELARRLAAGDLRSALEAAWWWLASSLVGETADPAWTTRELLAASGRPDLAPTTRRLDTMLYAGQRVDQAALEGWVREVEAKLPS